MSTKEVVMDELPWCDICKRRGVFQKASYDGVTLNGPWAYMCEDCFHLVGRGLGTGLGRKLKLEQQK